MARQRRLQSPVPTECEAEEPGISDLVIYAELHTLYPTP